MRRFSRHDHLERRQVGRRSINLELEDRHPSRKHGTSPPQSSIGRTHLICEHLVVQPIRVGSWFDPVFSILDDRRFMNPSVLVGRPGELPLDVPSVWAAASVTTGDYPQLRALRLGRSPGYLHLRFLPDVGTRGASSEHIYADASQRVFGIQIEVTSLSTKRETVQYELFIGRRLAYASRAAVRKVPMEKLPTALRGAGTCQLRYAVCWVICSCLKCVGVIRVSSAQESMAGFQGRPAR